jgi:hypothetical protein
LATPTASSRNAPKHAARALACFSINATTGTSYLRTGWAQGEFDCTSTYSYLIRLKNNAGSTMSERIGSASGAIQEETPHVGCAGAYVHAFVYRNWNGNGASDTGPTVFC